MKTDATPVSLIKRRIIASLNLLDTLANAAQYFISSHCLKGALMCHVQLVHWDCQVFSCKAAPQLASPQPAQGYSAAGPELPICLY